MEWAISIVVSDKKARYFLDVNNHSTIKMMFIKTAKGVVSENKAKLEIDNALIKEAQKQANNHPIANKLANNKLLRTTVRMPCHACIFRIEIVLLVVLVL